MLTSNICWPKTETKTETKTSTKTSTKTKPLYHCSSERTRRINLQST
jgi:hypothetical protein